MQYDTTASNDSSQGSLTATPPKTRSTIGDVQDIGSSPAQSVSPGHTGRESRKYYTPALPQGRYAFLSDLTGRLLDTQGSISNTSDTYYTALWGSPYTQPGSTSTDKQHDFDLSTRFLSKDSPTPGFSFDLDHLIPSRLAPGPPTDTPEFERHSALGFVDRPSAAITDRKTKRLLTRLWAEQSSLEAESPGNWHSETVEREYHSDLDDFPTPVPSKKLSGKGSRLRDALASPTVERRIRQDVGKSVEHHSGHFTKGHKSREDNKTLRPEDFNHFSGRPKTTVLKKMLASRWAPTPDRELYTKMQEQAQAADVEAKSRSESLQSGISDQQEDAQLNGAEQIANQAHPEKAHTETTSATRQKVKVAWKGKTCVVALPWEGPEAFGGSRPLDASEVQARLKEWDDAGFETRGFDLAGLKQDEELSIQGRPLYPDPADVDIESRARNFGVRVPDPRAWRQYCDFLLEEKLRALGVSTGLEDGPPAAPLQPIGRTFSPAFNATHGGQAPFSQSQRSTPGLSNFSTGPHSRSMSIASPMSGAEQPRGHMHRHSVFGMPFGFQQVQPPGQGFRSFSPSQQSSLNPNPRSLSPGMHGRMKSVSPVMSATSPIDLNAYRPSPVTTQHQMPMQQTLQNWTPPAHLRHQSLASSFSPQSMLPRTTISQPTLLEVPEDEEDVVDDYLARETASRNVTPAEIVVPTPRGHRHNISETLEEGVRDFERAAELDSQFAMPPPPPPANDSFSFSQSHGQQASIPYNYGSMPAQQVAPQQPFEFQQSTRFQPPAPMSFGHRSRLSVAAPEFNPGSFQSSTFQPAPQPAQLPSMPQPNYGQHTGHVRQQPSFNVGASAFKPLGFGTSSMPPTDFTFAPGMPTFQPPSVTISGVGHQSIFGNIEIPDFEPHTRKPKAVPITRQKSPEHEQAKPEAVVEAEDEHGRVLQSPERQKRAFKLQDDGNSIPLFAERPASPARKMPMQVHEDTVDAGIGRENDTIAHQNGAPETPTASRPQSISLPPVNTQRNHSRNTSSLSAMAKAFEPSVSQSIPAVPSVHAASPTDDHEDSFDLGKDEPNTIPVFSREAQSEREIGYSQIDPRKLAPERERSPYQLDELSFEPSFDEIDAVMRHLNDEDVDYAQHDESQDEQDVSRDYSPTPMETFEGTVESAIPSFVPSPTSLQFHSNDKLDRTVSPLSEEMEMPTLGIHRRVINSTNDAPRESLPTRSSEQIINDRLQTMLEQQLQPLHEQLKTVQEAIATPPSRGRRPRTSSGIESDADDEDDITDSKFLPRPVSTGRDKKLELIRATVLDAMSAHYASAGQTRPSDIQDTLLDMNAIVSRIASRHLDVDDVRIAVEEALHNHSRALIHVPAAEIASKAHSRQLSDLQARHDETLAKSIEESYLRLAAEEREAESRRLLALAEEELGLLRATSDDKDHTIRAREIECDDLRDRLSASEYVNLNLEKQILGFEDETAAMSATLAEYRMSSDKWRQDLDAAEADKLSLAANIVELNEKLVDGLKVRDSMRDKLERIQADMTIAAEQLANQKSAWSSRNEGIQKRYVVMQSRLEAETQLRTGLENEIQRLRTQVSEGTAAQMSLEQTLKSNILLEETINELKDELSEQQTTNSRIQREIMDARENGRLEVQRAELMMQAGIETANNRADAVRASLESKLGIATNEIENMSVMVEATKSRHDILLQEEADLRRDTLHKVNEASSVALDGLRMRHEEDILYVKTQRDRAIADSKQDKTRAEAFWQERLSLSQEKNGHLQERISHLEERLSISKSAAHAAISAAQAAKVVPSAQIMSSEPERISPQALRESILVLQEQLQEREVRIERLQQKIHTLDTDAPSKLKERDIEITWLRELLANRSDEISEIIDGLSQPDFDREAVRDAAIRVRTNLQMEQAEKERLINAGSSLTGQALAGITNFASPRAVQLAAAIGNWRTKGIEAMAANKQSPVGRVQQQQSSSTPSKRSPSSSSFLSGLMTPPASNLRRTPSPHSSSAMTPDSSNRPRSSHSNRAQEMRSRPTSAKTVVSAFRDQSPATPTVAPFSLRRQSYDADATLGAADDRMPEAADDEEDEHVPSSPGSPSVEQQPSYRSLATELEPLG